MSVVIAGGGLTGLSVALFLGQHGIRTTVVERHKTTSIHPKARGFNARTMEILRGAGLEAQVREAGAVLRDNHDLLFCETLDKPPFRRIEAPPAVNPELAVSPAPSAMCAQDELEPILLAAAVDLGADVRFDSEVQGFRQRDDKVEVTVDGEVIEADYLIACDGARSEIRESLGIAFKGDGSTFPSVGISFRADLKDLTEDPFIIARTFHPEAPGVMLPINNGDRWVFHVRVNEPTQFTDEQCKRLIRTATGRPELDIELVSVLPWDATSAVAEKYRQGRVFLVGDAAHLVPPTGAFGANTGIQDAHNLAWKLAFVLKGQASEHLLDTYEQERKPVAEMTADQAMRRLRAWEQHSGEEYEDDLVVIFGSQYVSSAIDNAVPRPLHLPTDGVPGTRVPHLWLDETTSTLDVIGQDFTLFHGDGRWHESPVKAHKADIQGAMLVRPDGYVAWRGEEPADLTELIAKLTGAAYDPRHEQL
ncbi:FAD-dependent monooxygenase [Actinocrispum sp. NPDC049592]|uniref:FAD-dependent monooxygenase n=1 Tax=Actinocrispum sp. NPDC049592 TaxID=3154835 RepID=UPI0034244FD6